MGIAEVARRSGIAASTLRFYEEKGRIASVGRQGLRRRFDPGVLDQLALIALAAVPAGDVVAVAGEGGLADASPQGGGITTGWLTPP